MRRIFTIFSAAMFALAMLVVPASAHPDPLTITCQGTAEVEEPGIVAIEDRDFEFTITVRCDTDGDGQDDATLTAEGRGFGRCGASTASGEGRLTFDSGHASIDFEFEWTSAGTVLVVTGTHDHHEEGGDLTATVQASGGTDCLGDGATSFDVAIAAVLTD